MRTCRRLRTRLLILQLKINDVLLICRKFRRIKTQHGGQFSEQVRALRTLLQVFDESSATRFTSSPKQLSK